MSFSATPSPRAAVRAVIIDDEPAARRGVRLLLSRDSEIEIVGEAGDGIEAVELIRRERPELAFLDVQMPGFDGFEVLRQAGDAAPAAVVFVTAYDEHALRAFEVHAIDYVLKPYEDARFHSAVERAKAGLRGLDAKALAARLAQLLQFVERTTGESAPAQDSTTAAEWSDRILLKSSGEIYFLKVDEIDWIEAEGDYMKFHVAGKAHLLRETMARLEARLDPERFIRIHRSTIVNIDRVRKLTPAFAGDYAVVLADGTKLRLSRGYQERMQAVMDKAR
ncbi:MAG: LytTR family DNA-binding domain-containing protein [Opitutaceae bacterium]|nr:LytTR family DNA-binding domain-containing protein [Opitutaceae bacterium]